MTEGLETYSINSVFFKCRQYGQLYKYNSKFYFFSFHRIDPYLHEFFFHSISRFQTMLNATFTKFQFCVRFVSSLVYSFIWYLFPNNDFLKGWKWSFFLEMFHRFSIQFFNITSNCTSYKRHLYGNGCKNW